MTWRTRSTPPRTGIGVSLYDLSRLGFEEGEELWAGVTIHADGKTSGNFRVLCDGEHDEEQATGEAREITRAVAVPA